PRAIRGNDGVMSRAADQVAFFFQAEDGIRDFHVTGVQTCALPIYAKGADKANTWSDITFEDFAAFVRPYTLDRTAQETGVPAERLKQLAELYADPKVKVMSLWTMGFNQHTRGVWANNMVYNLHLLTGKISEPGNSPFSLTGQPSACGSAREVGTFSHRLPADMLVTNPKHRAKAEEIWKLPPGTIPDKVGLDAVK